MQPLRIPIILGTSREGRISENVARFVEKQAQTAGMQTEFIDVRDYQTPFTERNTNDAKEKAWDEVASWADGFIIVTPEYNHSFPGELKILIDKAEKEYDKKVVAICTVSNGNVGGTRVREQLIPVMSALGMTVVNAPIYFTNADELFEESGKMKPEFEATFTKRLARMLQELGWYGNVLLNGRTDKN